VIDYFSKAENPDNHWGNSEKYIISIYIVDWVITCDIAQKLLLET
jgi:hypothetical protein